MTFAICRSSLSNAILGTRFRHRQSLAMNLLVTNRMLEHEIGDAIIAAEGPPNDVKPADRRSTINIGGYMNFWHFLRPLRPLRPLRCFVVYFLFLIAFTRL